MFIQKLIIDGFKSYGRRVEITGFDACFNAITGFNGSGKSNILDAICFALGLSKLELARCHLLSELIYKNGRAGVTTASVTMEIDNHDGKFTDVEFRRVSTITIKRDINNKNQSRYYINQICVTRERYLNFLMSVSLNIQNPHFLIMQGKIVKVIAMKPTEILSMIEEAVGVSIYENKKKQNLVKIEKCDNYLAEIRTIIEESIEPKLKQLKEEEKSLIEFRNIEAKYEQLEKVAIAYRYLKARNIVDSGDSYLESSHSLIENKTEENIQLKREVENLSKEIEYLHRKLDKELGGELKILEEDVKQKKNDLKRIEAKRQLKVDSLKEQQTELNKLSKKYEKDCVTVEKKRKEHETLELTVERLKNEKDTNEELYRKAQQDMEAVTLGLAKARDGKEAATLTQQLMATKDSLAEIESKINKSNLLIQHLSNELKGKKQKAKTDQEAYQKSSSEIDTKKIEMDEIQAELDGVGFNEERFEDVKTRLNQFRKDCRLLEDKDHQLSMAVPGSSFRYPYNDIDPSCIHGVVCELFTLKSPEYAVAIEKVCGARLYNVVVSDDDVGAAIIRKNLKERKTFLPLNKITGRDPDRAALRRAETLVGKENVHYAINLVMFDSRFGNAMKHVFGDTLVCPNMNMARKVAFDPQVMKRTVTYDGEIFDPSGTLTGGALRSGPQSLALIQERKECQEEINQLRIQIQQLEDEYNGMCQRSRVFYEKKKRLDLKQKEVELLTRRVEESSHYVLIKEIEDMEKILKEEMKNIQKYEEEKEVILNNIEDLKVKIENSEATNRDQKKEVKKHLENSKNKFEASSKIYVEENQKLECLTQEIRLLDEQNTNCLSQINRLESEIAATQKILDEFDIEIEECKKELAVAEEKYLQYKSVLNARSNEVTEKQKELDSMKNKIEENERQIKSAKFEIEKIHSNMKEAKERLKATVQKYSWILEEEKFFDSPDTEYGILNDPKFDEKEFFQNLTTLRSTRDSLARKVNVKANIMIGEKQKEFDELLRKRDITLQDRKKLMKYIEKVEKEKDTELCKAWEKINAYFGSIFSTLLPNTNAKLVPVNPASIKEGLEIKVAFGEQWKESLSELSGGQRSLMALSFVLSLLKYNPAPLYILDEIDAALDQSHTQNIGMMIRKHFQNAQFIIVSLKDDMFNNANVLFQTKFIDGYSTVQRMAKS